MYVELQAFIERLKKRLLQSSESLLKVKNPTPGVGASSLAPFIKSENLQAILAHCLEWAESASGNGWIFLKRGLTSASKRFDKKDTGLSNTYYFTLQKNSQNNSLELGLILETKRKTFDAKKDSSRPVFFGGYKQGKMAYEMSHEEGAQEWLSLTPLQDKDVIANWQLAAPKQGRQKNVDPLGYSRFKSEYDRNCVWFSAYPEHAVPQILGDLRESKSMKATIHAPFVLNLSNYAAQVKEEEAESFFSEIFEESLGLLTQLSASGFVFQDLKIDNLLWDRNAEKGKKLKLIDFANAYLSGQSEKAMAVASWSYDSPEIYAYYNDSRSMADLKIKQYFSYSRTTFGSIWYKNFPHELPGPLESFSLPNVANDIWAMACVWVELLTKTRFYQNKSSGMFLKTPFCDHFELSLMIQKAETFSDFLRALLNGKIPNSLASKQKCIEMIVAAMNPDREKRATVDDLKQLWFKPCEDSEEEVSAESSVPPILQRRSWNRIARRVHVSEGAPVIDSTADRAKSPRLTCV